MGAEVQVEGLCDWIAARDRQLRLTGGGCAAAAAVTGGLSLVVDTMLYLPLIPVAVAALWLAAAWSSAHLRRARSRVLGHPVVRAEAPWSLAARRAMPLGWYEAPITGSVHRLPDAWVWRPSRLVAADLPSLCWTAGEVAAATLTPMWGPLLPPRAQLRLHLRGGGTVELIVHEPERLLVFTVEDAALPA